jgi:hypothetical protein
MIEQCVFHFGFSKMHLVIRISVSIQQTSSGDNFTTDIFERLHISNLKDVSQSTNKVNDIQYMLNHNNRSRGADYMEETPSNLAVQDW